MSAIAIRKLEMAAKKQPTQILTLVFKVKNLSLEQEEFFLAMMDRLKILWNIGVKAFENFDRYTSNNPSLKKVDTEGKKISSRFPSCPIAVLPESVTPDNPSRWQYQKFYLIDPDTGAIQHNVPTKERSKYDAIKLPYCPLVDPSSWYVINRYMTSVKYQRREGVRQVQRVHNGRVFWHTLLAPEPVIFDKHRGWYCEDGGSGYSCPVVYPLIMINNIGQNKNSFQGLASEKRIRELCERPELLISIPGKIRQGLMSKLLVSAKEHYKWRKEVSQGKVPRKVGFPRYKKRTDKINSLSPDNASNAVTFIGNNKLHLNKYKLKKLGILEIIGLDKRWKKLDNSYYKVTAFRLVHEPDGWYVHLTTNEKIKNRKVKSTNRAIGIDFGLKDNTPGHYDLAISDWDREEIYPDSYKYHIQQRIRMPKYYRLEEEKIQKLQQKLNQKLTTKLILWLNHPDHTTEDICRQTKISSSLAENLLKCKTEVEILEYVSSSTMEYLKNRLIPDSKSILNLRNKIIQTQRKIKRRRKAFLEKLSTFLIRYFDIIKVENGLQSSNLKKKSQTKVSQDGLSYEKNQAAAKSGLAKSLTDASYGTFMAMLERKAQDYPQKQIIRIPAQNTTRTCPVCGTKKDMPPSIRLYQCDTCNWTCDRDINSGLNVLFHGEIPNDNILSSWAKKALKAREEWQLISPDK